MEKVLDRFLRYVSIDTQSNEDSESQPSTAKQLNLLRMLRDELQALGVDATLDEYGYVMGSIPSNLEGAASASGTASAAAKVPVIGFIAHVDTAPDASGADIKPQIINEYDGGDIPLKGVPGLALKPSEFPELLHYVGQTLVTTDGTTLLGADDKAGVAEIMDAVQYIVEHPEFKHGEIKIGFTPDEEIGRGVVKFDVAKFGAEYAYTMDGGEVGELEFENFNAASAKIHIQGRNVHPGYAKGKMINANMLAAEFASSMPADETPETTEGYQGFFHLLGIESNIEHAKLAYIIRDHDRKKFEERKKLIVSVADAMNEKYGEGTVEIAVNDQYYNMKEKIDPNMHVIDIVLKAMETCGVPPKVEPIRGGTDGAQLSFMGLPCPNIFAGGVNFHGPYEFVSIQVMEKAMQVVVKICELTAGYND